MSNFKVGDKAIILQGSYPIFEKGEEVTIAKDSKNKCHHLSKAFTPVQTEKNIDGYVCVATKNLKSIEKNNK